MGGTKWKLLLPSTTPEADSETSVVKLTDSLK